MFQSKTINQSKLSVKSIQSVSMIVLLEDGSPAILDVETSLLGSKTTEKPVVLEGSKPTLPVKTTEKTETPIIPNNGDSPLSRKEMVAALKAAGYKGGKCWWFKTEEKLIPLMVEMGLSPYGGNPAPQQQQNNDNTNTNNGNNGKPSNGGKPPFKGKDKPMETAIIRRSEFKPIRVRKSGEPSVIFPNGTTVPELYYTDESLTETGVKVFAPSREQSAMAPGYVLCMTWHVKDDNVVQW